LLRSALLRLVLLRLVWVRVEVVCVCPLERVA
jgi:hypothetical protein